MTPRSLSIALLASLLALGCEGAIGPPGEQGPVGPQGPTPPPGSVSTLPWHNCMTTVLEKPELGDLGVQIQPLLDTYACVTVKLPANTKWIWNRTVYLKDFQYLYLEGGGYTNNNRDTFGTKIDFSQNGTSTDGSGNKLRNPTRVLMGAYSSFSLAGLTINEIAADARELTPECYNRALFGAANRHGQSSIQLSNLVINTSESIVTAFSELSLRLVHVWVKKVTPGSLMRKAFLLTTERGGCENGVQANIFLHNYNPAEVDYDRSIGLTYLPPLP